MSMPPDPERNTRSIFDRAWRLLERSGGCDALGGVEYQRIRKMWDDLAGVLHAIDFISYHANCPPTGSNGKDGV